MKNYQQQDLQTLIDLLAKETELYTKALGSGKKGELAVHKITMEALVSEITRRKKSSNMPSDIGSASLRNDFSDNHAN